MAESERSAQVLHAIAAAGSFTAAAKRLGISQPSLSQCVQRLEAQWGVEVVERGARPVRLTQAGRLIAETERQAAQLRADCRRSIADLASGVRGRVAIGVSEYREAGFLTEVLPIFRERFPAVELFLEEGTTQELERFVLEGKADVSIGILPLEAGADQLQAEPLYQERLVLALSAAEAEAMGMDGRAAAFERFDGRPFIIVKEGQRLHELFETLCRTTGAHPKVVLESKALASALELSAAGLGATIVTDFLFDEFEQRRPGRLRAFAIEPEVPPRTVAAILRRDRYVPKAVHALLAVMKEAAGRMKPIHPARPSLREKEKSGG